MLVKEAAGHQPAKSAPLCYCCKKITDHYFCHFGTDRGPNRRVKVDWPICTWNISLEEAIYWQVMINRHGEYIEKNMAISFFCEGKRCLVKHARIAISVIILLEYSLTCIFFIIVSSIKTSVSWICSRYILMSAIYNASQAKAMLKPCWVLTKKMSSITCLIDGYHCLLNIKWMIMYMLQHILVSLKLSSMEKQLNKDHTQACFHYST